MMPGRYAKSLFRVVAGTALVTGMMLLGQEPTSEVPVLSLSQAIQIAVDNNRPVNMAKLEIVKSKWEEAQTTTKRFPANTPYLFASGDITNPKFTFPANLFNNPLPQTLKLSNGITGLASAQVAQPLSQLYQIHLAVREQELSTDLATEQYRGQRASLVASVKQAYYPTQKRERPLNEPQARG